MLGVTESRVSQIHTKAVLHLRSRLTAAGVASAHCRLHRPSALAASPPVSRRSRRSSMHRSLALVSAAVDLAPVGVGDAGRRTAAATCWLPPVDAPVVEPFRAPACPTAQVTAGSSTGRARGRRPRRRRRRRRLRRPGRRRPLRRRRHADGRTGDLRRARHVVARRRHAVGGGHVVGTRPAICYFGLRDGDVRRSGRVARSARGPAVARAHRRPRRRPPPPPRLRCPARELPRQLTERRSNEPGRRYARSGRPGRPSSHPHHRPIRHSAVASAP